MTKKETQVLPTFTLLDDYNAETQQQLAKRQEYAEKVKEAELLVQGLELRYRAAVTAAVQNGEDKAAELLQLSKEKSAAVRSLEEKRLMQQVAKSVQQRKITDDDIRRGLTTYQNEYQQDIIEPALKELRKAKKAYISQYLELMRKIEFFDAQAKLAYYTVTKNAISVPYGVGFRTTDNRKHKSITLSDVDDLEKGKKPSSLAPRTQQVVGQDGITRYEPLAEDMEDDNE